MHHPGSSIAAGAVLLVASVLPSADSVCAAERSSPFGQWLRRSYSAQIPYEPNVDTGYRYRRLYEPYSTFYGYPYYGPFPVGFGPRPFGYGFRYGYRYPYRYGYGFYGGYGYFPYHYYRRPWYRRRPGYDYDYRYRVRSPYDDRLHRRPEDRYDGPLLRSHRSPRHYVGTYGFGSAPY